MARILPLSRKAATILAGVAIGAAVAWEAEAQPRTLPDLTVSMSAAPVDVLVGRAYEIQIIIANTSPGSRRPSLLRDAPPIVPTPPVGGLEVPRSGAPTIAEGGADVQKALLKLTTTFAGHRPVSIQTQPLISTIRCDPAAGVGMEPDPTTDICRFGPLNKGGRWTITLVYPAVGYMRGPRGVTLLPGNMAPVRYEAHIDYPNQIVERDETNNKAQVSIKVQIPTQGPAGGPVTGGNTEPAGSTRQSFYFDGYRTCKTGVSCTEKLCSWGQGVDMSLAGTRTFFCPLCGNVPICGQLREWGELKNRATFRGRENCPYPMPVGFC